MKRDAFYPGVPVFHGFRNLMDPALYVPLPDDWIIGSADIVDSTRAIAEQRYKAVNMAGAAVIAAVTNALGEQEFPFVFGGDGASFAVAPAQAEEACAALAATAAWVKADLDLVMRTAAVPMRAVRAQGLDVRVARYAPSPDVSYAMFSGGGLGWVDAAMKRGEFAIPPVPSGAVPDLTGLSCRFAEIPASRGLILSVLVLPGRQATAAAFRGVIEDVVALIDHSPDAGRPVPQGGPPLTWPPDGLDYEARAAHRGPLLLRRASLLGFSLFAFLIMRFGISVGGFKPRTYVEQVVANSDFRKFDDALRMVVDCTPELEQELERRLAEAAAAGAVRYGLHRQDAAMMTCFTLSPTRSNHVHFIDGARGGYASAATALKAAG
ncbi:DUF3095 domain-containing protein [Bradyrhizobium sp. 2TAF24]|uniref:DUF3095 domain-containing protein n=1 Tax=Bradyrhizobium sp. 2TAF24 TaxID=3233011 RepID=UPI003F90D9BA